MNDLQFDKAMDELDEELEHGEITQAEYNRACRQLAEDFKRDYIPAPTPYR